MTPHSSLKRRVVEALRHHGCLVTSYDGSTAGVLDLFICTPDGGYAELDIKVGKDKLSKLQRNRISKVKKAQGVAAEVRSVDDALKACKCGVNGKLACPECGRPAHASSGCFECPHCGGSVCS